MSGSRWTPGFLLVLLLALTIMPNIIPVEAKYSATYISGVPDTVGYVLPIKPTTAIRINSTHIALTAEVGGYPGFYLINMETGEYKVYRVRYTLPSNTLRYGVIDVYGILNPADNMLYLISQIYIQYTDGTGIAPSLVAKINLSSMTVVNATVWRVTTPSGADLSYGAAIQAFKPYQLWNHIITIGGGKLWIISSAGILGIDLDTLLPRIAYSQGNIGPTALCYMNNNRLVAIGMANIDMNTHTGTWGVKILDFNTGEMREVTMIDSSTGADFRIYVDTKIYCSGDSLDGAVFTASAYPTSDIVVYTMADTSNAPIILDIIGSGSEDDDLEDIVFARGLLIIAGNSAHSVDNTWENIVVAYTPLDKIKFVRSWHSLNRDNHIYGLFKYGNDDVGIIMYRTDASGTISKVYLFKSISMTTIDTGWYKFSYPTVTVLNQRAPAASSPTTYTLSPTTLSPTILSYDPIWLEYTTGGFLQPITSQLILNDVSMWVPGDQYRGIRATYTRDLRNIKEFLAGTPGTTGTSILGKYFVTDYGVVLVNSSSATFNYDAQTNTLTINPGGGTVFIGISPSNVAEVTVRVGTQTYTYQGIDLRKKYDYDGILMLTGDEVTIKLGANTQNTIISTASAGGTAVLIAVVTLSIIGASVLLARRF